MVKNGIVTDAKIVVKQLRTEISRQYANIIFIADSLLKLGGVADIETTGNRGIISSKSLLRSNSLLLETRAFFKEVRVFL